MYHNDIASIIHTKLDVVMYNIMRIFSVIIIINNGRWSRIVAATASKQDVHTHIGESESESYRFRVVRSHFMVSTYLLTRAEIRSENKKSACDTAGTVSRSRTTLRNKTFEIDSILYTFYTSSMETAVHRPQLVTLNQL
jgi:hypothetical protein